ncbi:homeobox-leucine zipper protein HAT4-like [Primulina tabacum]|uniref:homeobox-leucine zipper protein HAT4-like n=1 Tax=Primulina tabacum TaxID=48773 RepID=UPI003F5A1767
MTDKDDGLGLGLGLSLRFPENQHQNLNSSPPRPPPTAASAVLPVPFPLNLFRSPLPFLQQPQQQHKPSNTDVFQLSADRSGEPRSYFRGIDVNRAITVIDCDEEAMVSSPNSTVSSVSGKRCEREENEAERASSSFEMEDDGGEAARKKLRLSKEQAVVLEETFKEHNTLNPKQKMALAKRLNLRPRQVEVWFQNRRARTKLKQTEVDCEYLRRCCENLTDENRRLQKEVNELRALKLSPQFYMNMSPPTTLTMCPQCERVAVSSATTTPAANVAAVGGINRQLQLPMACWAAVIPHQSAPRP